jgi:hypothetical protein
MGYMLMLVIMIYSGPLFMSVITGLVGGHILFNAKDSLLPVPNRAAPNNAPTCASNATTSVHPNARPFAAPTRMVEPMLAAALTINGGG